jgi:hypothetical protein
MVNPHPGGLERSGAYYDEASYVWMEVDEIILFRHQQPCGCIRVVMIGLHQVYKQNPWLTCMTFTASGVSFDFTTHCVPSHMYFTMPASKCGISSTESALMRAISVSTESFACACIKTHNVVKFLKFSFDLCTCSGLGFILVFICYLSHPVRLVWLDEQEEGCSPSSNLFANPKT